MSKTNEDQSKIKESKNKEVEEKEEQQFVGFIYMSRS
jgi:hypothetical protein